MTVDEIKETYSMTDIIEMYGLSRNRSGFCSCPFHGKDQHPSMKIYKKDYHCFTCGANGDIFTFVQNMEHCDFKEAFYKLGGNYEKKTSWQQQRFQYQLKQKREKRIQDEYLRKVQIVELRHDIEMQQLFIKLLPPFDDDWCSSVEQLQKDYLLLDEILGEEVH